MADRTVRVRLEAAVQGFQAALMGASQSVGRFGTSATKSLGGVKGAIGKLGPAAGLAGIGVAAGFKAAIDSAADFEESAMKLQTQVGLTADQARDMAEAAREIGTQSGIGAQEAIDASFFISSAGLRGEDAMDALALSADAARVGLGDTKDIADLLTSAMNAYGPEVLDAAEATDILMGAVREGKAEAPEFAAAMGRVLPIASELDIAFDDVAAAAAWLTRTGASVPEAMTGIRGIMSKMLRPTQAGAEELERVGLSMERLRDVAASEGLLPALQMLRDALGDDSEALGKVFEDVEGLNAVLALTPENATDVEASFGRIADSAGNLEDALEQVEGTTSDKINRMKAEWQDLRLNLADRTIPAIKWAIDDLNRGMERGIGASIWDFFTLRNVGRTFGTEQFFGDLFGTRPDDLDDPAVDITEWFTGDALAPDAATDALVRAREATAEYGDHMGRMPKTFSDYEEGQDDAAESTWDAAEASERARENLAEYQAELRAATDPVFALNRALSDATEAEQALDEAVKEHGATSQEAEEALWDLAEATAGVDQAALDGDLSWSAFDDQLAVWVDQGRITAEEADRLRGRVDDLVESVDAVEGQRTAELRADIGQAMGAVDTFIDHLTANGFSRGDAVSAARWTARANFHIETSGMTQGQLADAARYSAQGRAHGGPVKAGHPYVVGEFRPELFVPDVNGSILPSVPVASSAPAPGAGGSSRPVQLFLDGRVVAEAVIDPLSGEITSRQLQTAGGSGW